MSPLSHFPPSLPLPFLPFPKEATFSGGKVAPGGGDDDDPPGGGTEEGAGGPPPPPAELPNYFDFGVFESRNRDSLMPQGWPFEPAVSALTTVEMTMAKVSSFPPWYLVTVDGWRSCRWGVG